MADINLERKSPSVWPWVLGLLAVLLVVGIWMASTDDSRDDELAASDPTPAAGYGAERPEATPQGGAVDEAVDEYVAFAGLTGREAEPASMGREHEYTAEGLRKLTAALNSVVAKDGDGESRQRFERFRQTAERIQEDPASRQHANQVRDAFVSASEVISSFENASADEVRAIAESVDPDTPLLEQREKVQRFFQESARQIRAAAIG